MDPASWQEVKDVIAEAMRLPPSERDRFVRERCSDPRVASEILALLGDRRADGDATIEDAAALDLEPGTRIGPYVVIDTIGRGAMGQVFLVSDPRLRRRVALKCVLGRDDQRARILHEARAAARVSHPNVAAIHDVVEHDDRAFIVMEYVEGESLASRLRRERLLIPRAIAIGCQLASALAAAHAKGVIHRDLKPGNIQLTPDGSIKVLDFGIANAPVGLTSPPGTAESTSTVSAPPPSHRSAEPGTPPYMAPEQLRGQQADERTDIYSLGVVLFEMLTQRRPYLETTRPELMAAHDTPAPRADRVESRVPRALADVVARMLATDPAQRYESATQLAGVLADVQQTLDRSAQGALQRSVRWGARFAAAAFVAAAIIILLGLITTLVFDVALGRRGFASDPLSAIWTWGQRSIVGPLVLVALICGVVWAAGAIARLMLVMPVVSRYASRIRRGPTATALASLADNPSMLAQIVALGGGAALMTICWRFRTVISAWAANLSEAPAAVLATLADHDAQSDFRYYVSLLVVVTGLAIVHIVRLRAHRASDSERGSLYACVAVLATAVIVNDAPYRLVYDTERERVVFGGQRCYAVADAAPRVLLFCPDLDPPRNRIVNASDPALRRTGIAENMFARPR